MTQCSLYSADPCREKQLKTAWFAGLKCPLSQPGQARFRRLFLRQRTFPPHKEKEEEKNICGIYYEIASHNYQSQIKKFKL